MYYFSSLSTRKSLSDGSKLMFDRLDDKFNAATTRVFSDPKSHNIHSPRSIFFLNIKLFFTALWSICTLLLHDGSSINVQTDQERDASGQSNILKGRIQPLMMLLVVIARNSKTSTQCVTQKQFIA